MNKVLSAADPSFTSGSPYWGARNPGEPLFSALTEEVSCHVAIVGGGITGSLLAYRMAAAGLSVVLLDKKAFGTGSTSASTALVGYEYDLTLSDLIEAVGEKGAVRAYELSYEATAGLKGLVEELEEPCDHEDKEAIRVSNCESDYAVLEAEAKVRNRHGFKVELFDESELKRKFGIRARMGLVTGNGAQIDPVKLARRLIQRGLEIKAFTDSKVTTYESGKGGIRLGTASGGVVHAKHVVFATGYEARKYLPKKLTKANTDFCFMSKPIRDLGKLKRSHIVEHADDYIYLSTFGDRVMVGVEGPALYGPKERSHRLAPQAKRLLERVHTYLPDLELEIEMRWASTFVTSPDSLPYVGELKRFPGAYFALGYGGNGIASSALLAPILVDLVKGMPNLDAKIFAFDR